METLSVIVVILIPLLGYANPLGKKRDNGNNIKFITHKEPFFTRQLVHKRKQDI